MNQVLKILIFSWVLSFVACKIENSASLFLILDLYSLNCQRIFDSYLCCRRLNFA